MIGLVAKMGRRFFMLIAGLMALGLLVFWVFKVRNIHRLRGEIVQVETKLSKGQELWKSSPPLTLREKEGLQKSQAQLLRMLPREKDVPSVLQEVSRVARDYSLTDLSLSAGDGVSPPPAGQPAAPASSAPQPSPVPVVPKGPAASPPVARSSGPIDSFTVRLTFGADYREIAFFLEGLQKIPRPMTVQTLQLQRALPLVMAEVVLNAYYLKGDLSTRVK